MVDKAFDVSETHLIPSSPSYILLDLILLLVFNFDCITKISEIFVLECSQFKDWECLRFKSVWFS